MQRYMGYVFIFLAAWFWSLLGILSKFVLNNGMDPSEAAFWRAAIGGLFFATHALVIGKLKLNGRKDAGIFLAFGIFAGAGMFTSYLYAVKVGGAALASVLLYTAPAWVAVLSRIIFKEGFTPIKITAIAVSLAGTAFVSCSGGGGTQQVGAAAVIAGLFTGFAYSSHYIFAKVYLERYSALTIYAFTMIVAAVCLYPFVNFMHKSPLDWLIVFLLGFVCCYLAFWAYCEGLKRLMPARAAVLATLEPIFAVLMAWAVWDETFSVYGWIGAGCILSAVLMIVAERPAKPKKIA